QHRTLKSGEVSWRCLGKGCGASIKTDKNITRVTHSSCSDHSVDRAARTFLAHRLIRLNIGPAYSTPGQVSVLTVTPSGGLPSGALARMIVMVASERPLKTSDMAIPTTAVTPQNQHSGRLQHISYAEAVRKYPEDLLQPCHRDRESCWCQRSLRAHIANYFGKANSNQCKQKLYNNDSIRLFHQNAQLATNKLKEFSLWLKK
ncbi:hypothetical protein J6590_095417, partial [Homalodisca vitripennis]